MGGRPAKHLTLVEGHLTKRQIDARKKGQEQVSAKSKMKKSKEVASNKTASMHFNRLRALYTDIDMCDGLCENTINRYCLMLANLAETETTKEKIVGMIRELEEKKPDLDFLDYITAAGKLTDSYAKCERSAAKIRDQLLAIEKESLLTMQGKLRAVPKKQEDKKEVSGFAAYRQKYG